MRNAELFPTTVSPLHARSTFYCVVVKGRPPPDPNVGVKVVTSPVPIKPPEFATTKSVNYLPNAMVVADAHDRGADYGVWVTEDGLIGEGPSMNIGFVTRDGAFRCPPFDDILAGCTIARVMELVNAGVVAHLGVTRAEQGPVTPEEAKAAREVMLVGSVIHVQPVVLWDGEKTGEGVQYRWTANGVFSLSSAVLFFFFVAAEHRGVSFVPRQLVCRVGAIADPHARRQRGRGDWRSGSSGAGVARRGGEGLRG